MNELPTIIFEDEALVCIDKPPGLVVNRARSVKEKTVQDWVEKNFQLSITNHPHAPLGASELNTEEIKEFISKSGVVHRIDKETSGLLLIAKTPESYSALKKQFMDHRIQKTYLALVHGVVLQNGEIRAPVGRLPWNPEHFGILPGGKESVTTYKRVKNYELPFVANAPQGKRMTNGKKEPVSLVEVMPQTGRTHQIRVHFKYIGHPLVGDYLYAGRKTSRDDRKEVGRVMLHAWKLSFVHPTTGKPLALAAPIPDDMNRIINSDKL